MNRSFPAFLALLLLSTISPLAAHAASQEAAQASSELSWTGTTDRIRQWELDLGYRSQRRDPFWEFPGEPAEEIDAGAQARVFKGENTQDQYRGARVAGLVGRKFSHQLLIDLLAGPHALTVTSRERSSTTLFIEPSVYWLPTESLNLTFRASHDYLYQDLVQPGGVSDFLTATSGELAGSWRMSPRLKTSVRGTFRSISDSNHRRHITVDEMFGISIGVPWIWAGLGGEYLSYSERMSGYWSPTRFVSGGFRFEAVVPIVDQCSASTGLNLNVSKEEDFPNSSGYYASLKLQYGARDALNVSAGYIRIQSIQFSGRWSSEQFLLSLNSPL